MICVFLQQTSVCILLNWLFALHVHFVGRKPEGTVVGGEILRCVTLDRVYALLPMLKAL